MSVINSRGSSQHTHTQLLMAKQERQNPSERHRQQPGGEDCITGQDRLCSSNSVCVCLCVCAFFLQCRFVDRLKLPSVPAVHADQAQAGPYIVNLLPDVLGAQWEATMALEGSLIYVM